MMQATLPQTNGSIDTVDRTSILFVDAYAADLYVPSLRTRVEVTVVSSEDQALRALGTIQPSLVVTELALPDGDGVSICRRAKAIEPDPPSVLVTTAVPERVPDALAAGCDGVLLKPFAANLLYGRIGRLLRQRGAASCERAAWSQAKALFLIEEPRRVMSGTNIVWRDTLCPSCGQGGVVSFDAAASRRLWYACLPCRTVWLGSRGEA